MKRKGIQVLIGDWKLAMVFTSSVNTPGHEEGSCVYRRVSGSLWCWVPGGTGHCSDGGGVEEWRQRGTASCCFWEDISSFFLPPSDRSAFGRMHNKKLQTFHQGVFLSLCPFATEISTENDSMIHVQWATAAPIQQKNIGRVVIRVGFAMYSLFLCASYQQPLRILVC